MSTPVFTSVAAHLYVRDIAASTAFFCSKLGFALDFVYGEPPFYGQVRRDNVLLALRQVDGPVFDPIMRQQESLLSATITLATADEIETLFLTYQDQGVNMEQPLREEFWGARTFIVADPDGNLLLFASPV